MSLHIFIEPAGTLMTGWKLVPQGDVRAADVRNTGDPAPELDFGPVPADDAVPVDPASKWETKWELKRQLGEVR